MDKMHRAQILLERHQHQELAEVARREGTSISEIVREAVGQWLDARGDEEVLSRRLADLEQIAQHRQAILDRRSGEPLEIDLIATIEKMRGERDDELIANAFSHRN